MRPRLRILMAAVLLAACLPAVLQARVFRRWGTGTGASGTAMGDLGRSLYRTVMSLNGHKVDVDVRACETDLDGIRQAWGRPGAAGRFVAGDGLGIGETTRDGRPVRFVALSPRGDAAPAVAVTVERSEAGRAAAASGGRHEIPGIPLYPGSRVTTSMLNQDTRTAFELVAAPGAPAEVMAFYETSLRRLGWEQPFPGGGEAGRVAVFAKGADLCCVQTRSGSSDGETKVSLLHKQGALKGRSGIP